MDSHATTVWTAFAGVLLATGAAAILTAGTDALNDSWRRPTILGGVACIAAGFLIFLVLLVQPLQLALMKGRSRFRSWKIHKALYLQTLRCTNGHVFQERVRLGRGGWLPRPDYERRCPECGDTSGFESLGAVPMNLAAKIGRYLPPPDPSLTGTHSGTQRAERG